MSRIAVMGAGSIGGYVGGRLIAAGADVVLIGRERLQREIGAHGLKLSDYRGYHEALAPQQVTVATSAEAAAGADLVLVTVKSAATAAAGAELAQVLRPGAVAISLQNGLGNAAVLRAALPQRIVLAGMVPFNVVQGGEGRFHQGTEGELEVERHAALEPFLALFARAGLPLVQQADLAPVQWGKLLLNLNNPINALCGLPLRQQLSQRSYRRCLALAQREALGLLAGAGLVPARLTALPPHWIPRVLELPDVLFRRIAARMLAIDPLARSSMWEDLQAGRATEVDWINGEIVRLAQNQGRRAPVNARLAALVHAAGQGGRRDWSGPELLAQLREVATAG
ncbi:2-dehydropantoate 2-reductase [Tahibacter harae]|uniref:2-dehydropantoate 2-reductase n=1 Tax=Tahibacter harae TaxID=2963937 RepID=A0ABT1QQ40_9GAMM|nr:2-dehydropantoate 2-reductase [Tahibacter harae]MCQ4164380.1 2-dehydropantoate 2-reductase [Tahibacter harae]